MNFLKHAVDIPQDLVVPKPQHAITLRLYELATLGVSKCLLIMLAAIDFNHELGPVRYKVSDVATEPDLSPEVSPFET